MNLLQKAGFSLALSFCLLSVARAEATQTITSSGTDQSYAYNVGLFEIGRVTLEFGVQSITALDTTVTLIDQGWGGENPNNGVFVRLLSNNQDVYTLNVAGATHNWTTVSFSLLHDVAAYDGINAALAGIDRNNGPIQMQFLTNAWGYIGWELHTRADSLSVTTSLLPAYPLHIPAVPEPETYAMLLLGLGAIGLAKQRKNRRQLIVNGSLSSSV
jgi:hypothetical protein